MLKRGVIIFATMCLALLGKGDALYWMIDETAYVDGNPIETFISPLPDDDENWAVGRVKITTSSGVIKYLDTYVPDSNPNIPGIEWPGNEGLYVGGGGVFEGIAEYTQGILPTGVNPETTFAIELGLNHWIDDGTEEGRIDFELLAITNPHTYEQIEQFIHPQGSISPPSLLSWNPTYYHTIPEPTTFLLLLLGFGILALRRNNGNR